MMDELKPCPFCGSIKVRITFYDDNDVCVVECQDCGALGPIALESAKAIEAWNKREASQ